jgi:hypothetical protein
MMALSFFVILSSECTKRASRNTLKFLKPMPFLRTKKSLETCRASQSKDFCKVLETAGIDGIEYQVGLIATHRNQYAWLCPNMYEPGNEPRVLNLSQIIEKKSTHNLRSRSLR